ncbi:hypothetical protein ACFW81_10690 [Streptomyces angustmyceticus]|uniref:hypothetical protein n=1 Tax=Streptomyces angustmyceticus TaxID=285578 RepID=UPI0036903A73
MGHALPHEVQLLAEVGQAPGEDIQLGGAAAGAVNAAPLRGGLEYLVQPGHRAEVPRDGRGEQLVELVDPGGGKKVAPADGRDADARTHGRGTDFFEQSVFCPRCG